jgi:hypothetical protein
VVEEEFVPELAYDITLDEAEKFETQVSFGNYKLWKTFKWIALHRPLVLEAIVDQGSPGTVEYWAACLVYSAYESTIRPAIEGRDRHIQQACLEGIENAKVWRVVLTREAKAAMDALLEEEPLPREVLHVVERERLQYGTDQADAA